MAKAKYKESDDKPKRPEPVKRDGAYVMMLFITFVAVVTGAVLMYQDHDEYSGKTAPKEPVPALQKLGDVNKTEAPTGGGGAPVTPPTPPMP